MVLDVRMIQLFIVGLLMAAVFLGGCSGTEQSQKKEAESTVGSPIEPLKKEEILTLLSEATKIDNQFFDQKFHTKEEIYAHYDSHFTRNYVDHIILEGGNLKLQGEQWVIANEGGEFLEGTFINEINSDITIELSEDRKTTIIRNSVGDGLYAPHEEVITIIHTENGWKVDHLKWVY